jgi:hypothetical protein
VVPYVVLISPAGERTNATAPGTSISRAIEATRVRSLISSIGVNPAVELADEDGLGDGPAPQAPTSKATPTIAPTVWIHRHPGRTGEGRAQATTTDLLDERTSVGAYVLGGA